MAEPPPPAPPFLPPVACFPEPGPGDRERGPLQKLPFWHLPLLRVKDTLSHQQGIRDAAAVLKHLPGLLRGRPLARLETLQATESPCVGKWLQRGGPPAGARSLTLDLLESRLGRYRETRNKDARLTRSLILKAPVSGNEKGVLYAAFEYNLYRLLKGLPEGDRFHQEYDVILGSSWSPTSYALLLWAVKQIPGTLHLEASNPSERDRLAALHPRIRVVPTMPCDWVDPSRYAPLPHASRTHDLLMVANWAPFKRHFELFQALARMSPDLKVALVGQKEAGWTVRDILNLARHAGVRQRIELFESIPIHQVRALQADSRAAVLMSRREGSCVAAVEALFANTPLGMREDAHVGALDYVNAETGRRFSVRRPLHAEMESLLHAAPSLQPRAWAEAHISCSQSIAKLNAALRSDALDHGRPWTSDLLPMCWNPYPMYLREADRGAMLSYYHELHQRLPEVFPDNLV